MSDRALVSVRIWDLPTRLFHWTLLVLVVASVITGKFASILGPGTLEWHKRSGLAILAVLLFRVGWGFAGGTHARFASFLRGPRAVVGYARILFTGDAQAEPAGHNPLGGWSIVAMLSAIALQVGSGLFLIQEDYVFEAPLARHVSRAVSDRLGAIHAANSYAIAALVALHIAAVVFFVVVKRQGLIGAMISGRKSLEPGREGEASRGGGMVAATAVAIAAATAVSALVAFA